MNESKIFEQLDKYKLEFETKMKQHEEMFKANNHQIDKDGKSLNKFAKLKLHI